MHRHFERVLITNEIIFEPKKSHEENFSAYNIILKATLMDIRNAQMREMFKQM